MLFYQDHEYFLIDFFFSLSFSMASPHVAGLAAYFLSLYPESFSATSEEFVESAYSPFSYVNEESTFVQQSAQKIFGTLSRWTPAGMMMKKIGEWTSISVIAPIPVKPLSPKALKNALLKLSTKNALSSADMPAGTPNLLIFNN